MSTQSTQHHITKTTHKDTRRGMDRESDHMPQLHNVQDAISKARMCYESKRYAAHPIINHCEDWINSSPNAEAKHIQMAIEMKQLHRSSSSGRVFIQLER